MCKFNKNKLRMRLIFVTQEFKDDIWSFSAKVLIFLEKIVNWNCIKKKSGKEEGAMKYGEKIQKKVSYAVIKIAEKAAHKTCNSACLWWQYQPKMPKSLKNGK